MSPKPRPDRPERREEKTWRPKGPGAGSRGPAGHGGKSRPSSDFSADRRPPGPRPGPRPDSRPGPFQSFQAGPGPQGPRSTEGHGPEPRFQPGPGSGPNMRPGQGRTASRGPRLPGRPPRPWGPPRPVDRFEGRPAWAAPEPFVPGPDQDGPPDDRDSRPQHGPGPTGERGDHPARGRGWPQDDRRGGPPGYSSGGRRPAPGARPGAGRPWDQPRTYSNAPVPTAEQLGPDEELVAGRRPVEEAFAARPPSPRNAPAPDGPGAHRAARDDPEDPDRRG